MYHCKTCNIIGYGRKRMNHTGHNVKDIGYINDVDSKKHLDNLFNHTQEVELTKKTPLELLELKREIDKHMITI